jgi:hypothetical protein
LFVGIYIQGYIYARTNGTFALGPLERGAHRFQPYKINYIPFLSYFGKTQFYLDIFVGIKYNKDFMKTTALINIDDNKI